MDLSRKQLFGLWILCTATAPLLLAAMLLHATVGSKARAKSMALSQDEEGNVLLGGRHGESISTHVGNALREGRTWAKLIAPCIDALFGTGHCLANATPIAPGVTGVNNAQN